MSLNVDIANIFYEIADILELKKIKWKPQAYRRAAKSLINLDKEVNKVYNKGGLKALEEIPGVGERLAKKIVEYIKTKKIKEYERVKKLVPKHFTEISKIPGLGVKRAKKLYKNLGIKSIEDLKKAVRKHKIRSLEGFGEKSERNIAEALNVYKEQTRRRPLKEVLKIANKVKRRLEKLRGSVKVDIAGSIRRKKDLVRDIDILAISKEPGFMIDYFCKMKEVKKVLAKGSTKASILLNMNIEADLRVVPEKSYGAALLYFTGSKEFNIKLRKIAIKKGYKLSEYGLFDRKTGKFIAGKSEKEILRKLGLKYIEPEKR